MENNSLMTNEMIEQIKQVMGQVCANVAKGFMFVGTQQRITLGNEHYYESTL